MTDHGRRMLGFAAAALALAGCNEKRPEHQATNEASASDAANTNYQQAVMALPDKQRDAVLLRAIRDAGLACQNVVSSERVPDEKPGPTWRAKCQDGSYHLVSVRADGVGIVLSVTR